MDSAKIEILMRAVGAVTRLIMQLRNRDAEGLVTQLEAMGRAPRADVESIDAAALAALRAAPIGGGTCGLCRQPYAVCVCDPMTAGPLGEGD